MMNPSRSLPASGNSGSTRLWPKVVGLFVLSFALFFVLFFAYDLLAGFAEQSAATGQVSAPPPVVIDPKIADDLAKVLAFDANPNSEDVRDPFSDRSGLSGSVAASTTSSAVQASLGTPGSPALGSALNGPVVPGSTGTNASGPPANSIEATKQRYDTWVERFGIRGDVPLDPRVFAIEDLLPVGIVDGGNGQQEVMFFSEAAGKTISFPLGTMFFDGWLTELRPEGVVFSFNDDRRTVKMRSWARSLKNVG